MFDEAAVAVGVVAPVGVVLVLALIFGGWQGLVAERKRHQDQDELRTRTRGAARLMRREAQLRRQRDIRLGRLSSDDQFSPRDAQEGVRVIRPQEPSDDL